MTLITFNLTLVRNQMFPPAMIARPCVPKTIIVTFGRLTRKVTVIWRLVMKTWGLTREVLVGQKGVVQKKKKGNEILVSENDYDVSFRVVPCQFPIAKYDDCVACGNRWETRGATNHGGCGIFGLICSDYRQRTNCDWWDSYYYWYTINNRCMRRIVHSMWRDN